MREQKINKAQLKGATEVIFDRTQRVCVFVCVCICVCVGEPVFGSTLTEKEIENQYHEESTCNKHSHYLRVSARTHTYR